MFIIQAEQHIPSRMHTLLSSLQLHITCIMQNKSPINIKFIPSVLKFVAISKVLEISLNLGWSSSCMQINWLENIPSVKPTRKWNSYCCSIHRAAKFSTNICYKGQGITCSYKTPCIHVPLEFWYLDCSSNLPGKGMYQMLFMYRDETSLKTATGWW